MYLHYIYIYIHTHVYTHLSPSRSPRQISVVDNSCRFSRVVPIAMFIRTFLGAPCYGAPSL